MNQSTKRLDIQVLRAVSVLAVLVFHLNPDWLRGGYLGVDVFFVISGFIITGIFLRRGEEFSITDFYLRRVTRLFPALLVMLVVVLIFAIIAMQPADFLQTIRAFQYSALQAANFYFIQGAGYFEGGHEHSPLLHTWSLGVEEQFYLVWAPLFFWLYKKLSNSQDRNAEILKWIGVLALSSFVMYLALKLYFPKGAFYLPFARGWELMLGAGIAIKMAGFKGAGYLSGNLSPLGWWSGLVLIMLSVCLGSASGWLDTFSKLAACSGAGLCLWYQLPFRKSVFKPIIYLGDISYSLYLWHWPVICFAFLLGYQIGEFKISLLLGVLSIVLGALSYHLIERFGQRRADHRSLVYAMIAAMVGLFALSSFLSDSDNAEWRVTRSFDSPKIRYPKTARQLEPLRRKGVELEGLLLSEVQAQPTVLLMGDSHAGHFVPLVHQWAEEKNMQLETFHQAATLPFSEHIRYQEIENDGSVSKDKSYKDFADFIKPYLKSADYITHVFIAQRTDYYLYEATPAEKVFFKRGQVVSELFPNLEGHEIYHKELKSFIDFLTSLDKKIVLIGQTPPLSRSPNYSITVLDRFLEKWLNHQPKVITNQELVLSDEALRRLDFENAMYEEMAKMPNVDYFRTRDFIPAPITPSGRLLYRDDDHLNQFGSELLVPHLISRGL